MALLCGGWFTTDSGQSLPKQNFLKGEDQMSSLDIVDIIQGVAKRLLNFVSLSVTHF